MRADAPIRPRRYVGIVDPSVYSIDDCFIVVFLHSLHVSGVFKYAQKLSFFAVTK